MGYYIQTGAALKKGEALIAQHGAKEVTYEQARDEFDGNHDTVIVVSNGAFEAAGFCYSKQEFEAFTDFARDRRPRRYFQLTKGLAAQLSGYNID